MENDTRNAQISELNDKLRRTGRGGRTYTPLPGSGNT